MCFKKRLKQLGFTTYQSYLASDLWHKFKEIYFSSSMPRTCMGCRNSIVMLHHITYQRLGEERLSDVIPLCFKCHRKVHRFHDSTLTPLSRPDIALKVCSGWSVEATKEKFKVYYELWREAGLTEIDFSFTYRKKKKKNPGKQVLDLGNKGPLGKLMKDSIQVRRYREEGYTMAQIASIYQVPVRWVAEFFRR